MSAALTSGLLAYGGFIALCAVALHLPGPISRLRDPAFALVSLWACDVLYFSKVDRGRVLLSIYCGVVVLHWALVRFYERGDRTNRKRYLIAFCAPVVLLIAGKVTGSFVHYVGASYMAFRLSYLVFEMRGEPAISVPFGRYLAFAFFWPTLPVGPIGTWTSFARSFDARSLTAHNLGHGALRILAGGVKLVFVGNYFNMLTFSSLWQDGFRHGPSEIVLSCLAYYLYLYFNFSGACDMAVGAAAMMGVHVDENFDRHYMSRNLKEFWSRWHMTLSRYLRDVFFTPLTLSTMRRFSPRQDVLVYAFGAFATMLLIGAWHGVEVGYLVFGALQGVGLAAVYVWDWLLRQLDRTQRRAYKQSRIIRACAMVATHTWFAMTLFFFENHSLAQIRGIVRLVDL